MENFKLRKVFDCQWDPGMPDDVRKAFFDFCECGNDVYVEWTVHDSIPSYNEDGTLDKWSHRRKLVDDWLIENGAEAGSDKRQGETVLIKHWW